MDILQAYDGRLTLDCHGAATSVADTATSSRLLLLMTMMNGTEKSSRRTGSQPLNAEGKCGNSRNSKNSK